MQIALRNDKSLVLEATHEERDWLWNYLVIRTPRFVRDRATGRTSYDGEAFEHMFDLDAETFPAGFTRQVTRKGVEHGLSVKVVDQRVRPAEPNLTADLAWLRDYQLDSVHAMIARTRGLLQAGTGSGKTEVIAALLRVLDKMPWVILVHRAGLQRDIGARIQKRCEEHGLPPEDIGYFGDGSKELGHRVTIATFAMLIANMRNPAVRAMLAAAQGFIVDEAHTVAADGFARVIEQLSNAYWRFGVSGTPLARGDKRSSIAIGLIGPVVFRVTADELIKRGVLARSEIRMVRHDGEEVYSSLWPVVRGKGLVGSVGRNRAVLSAVQRARKPAMVFVDILEHGQLLNRAIQKLGLNVDFVFGAKDTQARERALQRLVRGEIDVLVSSTIFNEGIDVPSLESVVLAAGGKSVIGLLQRIGRGMRKTASKSSFQVWDFEDRHNRILENHYMDRKRAYKKEGHVVQVDVAAVDLKLEPDYAR